MVGLLEMLASEPRDAVDIVFGAAGASNAANTALDDVVVVALGLEPRADRAVLLPRFGTWSPPVQGEGLATARVAAANEVIVVTDRVRAVDVGHVHAMPVGGVDPDGGYHRVRVDPGEAVATEADATAWGTAVAAARRAIAHQIGGGCRTMLDLACTHARERVQFGRPIARFQAVRHRLADALVAIESLDAALVAAWDEPNDVTAALAKAIAGRTANAVATQCQQVLAGIGFTTDHPFHRFLKRTLALEGLFGGSDDIVTALGRDLIRSRYVPTLIEL
jgi:alkylation response protein AidB-like acyl-CoA dehydrogenase